MVMNKDIKFTYILVVTGMDIVLRNELILGIENQYERFYTDEDEHRAEIGFGTKEVLQKEQLKELSQPLSKMNVELRLLGYTNFLKDINCHIYKDGNWKKLLDHH